MQLADFGEFAAVGGASGGNAGQHGFALVALHQLLDAFGLGLGGGVGGLGVRGELFHVARVDGLEEGLGAHPVQADVGGPVVHQGALLDFTRGHTLAGVLEGSYAPDAGQCNQRGNEQDDAKTQTQTGADAEVADIHGDLVRKEWQKCEGDVSGRRGFQAGVAPETAPCRWAEML